MVNTSNLTTAPIHVVQFNAQHSSPTITTLLNKHCRDIDILLLQEPHWAGLGNDASGKRVHGPVRNGSWKMIIPVESQYDDDPRPRVMVYYKANPTFQLVHRTDIISHPDVMVIDLVQEGQPTICLVNIYNCPDRANRSSSVAFRLRYLNLPTDRPVILAGDWNIHHPLWSINDARPTANAAAIADWLDDKGFTIQNSKGEATWHAQGRRHGESVIDLTFCNTHATQLNTVKEWALDPRLSYGSDHTAIRWTIDPGVREVENVCGLKYNMKDVDDKEWITAFQQRLEPKRHALTPLLSRSHAMGPNELDKCTEVFQDLLNDATAAVAKQRKPSASAKPWWDRELSAAAERVNDAKEAQKAHVRDLGTKSRALHSKLCKSKNYFRRLCKFKRSS